MKLEKFLVRANGFFVFVFLTALNLNSALAGTMESLLAQEQANCAFQLGEKRPRLLRFEDADHYQIALAEAQASGRLIAAVEPYFLQISESRSVAEYTAPVIESAASVAEFFQLLFTHHYHYPADADQYFARLNEEASLEKILETPPVGLLATMVGAINRPGNPEWLVASLLGSITQHWQTLRPQNQTVPIEQLVSLKDMLRARMRAYAKQNKTSRSGGEFLGAAMLFADLMNKPSELLEFEPYLDLGRHAPLTVHLVSRALFRGLMEHSNQLSQTEREFLAEPLWETFRNLIRSFTLRTGDRAMTSVAAGSVMVAYAALGLPDFPAMVDSFLAATSGERIESRIWADLEYLLDQSGRMNRLDTGAIRMGVGVLRAQGL